MHGNVQAIYPGNHFLQLLKFDYSLNKYHVHWGMHSAMAQHCLSTKKKVICILY